ncbi:MAG: hypothetical protein ACI4RJ_00010 [Alphaproteobacteria bacterium]
MGEKIVEPANEYDVLLNEDNEVLIAIRARLGEVEKPHILYAGQDKILLYRNSNESIFLADVPPQVRDALKKVSKLLMVEVHDESIVREYFVPLKIVSKLPV